jgi:hypothetical protein
VDDGLLQQVSPLKRVYDDSKALVFLCTLLCHAISAGKRDHFPFNNLASPDDEEYKKYDHEQTGALAAL